MEVGYFVDPDIHPDRGEAGFILFDGGYSGQLAIYERKGLNHTWFWCDEASYYLFAILTNDAGAYSDVINVPDGESAPILHIFKCKKR